MKTFLAARPVLAAALALAWALAGAGPALAEGLGPTAKRTPPRSMKDEPYAPPATFSWTGLYIGGHVGYGWSDSDWNDPVLPFSESHNGSGGLAGGQIGYNWQSGNLVFGIEADASSSWIDGASACCGHNVNWLATVRGRLGVTGNANRTLFYLTAGGAWADIDHSAPGFGTFSDTHRGWVAGAGIEHMLTPNTTARIEYLYYGFDDVSAPAGVVGVGATSLDPTIQTVRVGLNFKF